MAPEQVIVKAPGMVPDEQKQEPRSKGITTARKKKPKELAVITECCTGCAGSPACVEYCPVEDCMFWVPDEDHYPFGRIQIDPILCIGCNLCALACPENLIVVGWERDDATRRKVLTFFTYDTSRCMFCGLCEDACPTDALELTQDFEMAYFTREGAIWDRHRLEQGPTPARYTR